jgi:uncharacterized protein YegL
MAITIPIPDVSLQDNTDERTPLVLVLDRSGSMSGERIAALNAGLQTFGEEMINDPTSLTRGRVLVIEYGGDNEVKKSLWQDAIDFKAPILDANGTYSYG